MATMVGMQRTSVVFLYLLLSENASSPAICWLGGAVSHGSLPFLSQGWRLIPTRPLGSAFSGRIF